MSPSRSVFYQAQLLSASLFLKLPNFAFLVQTREYIVTSFSLSLSLSTYLSKTSLNRSSQIRRLQVMASAEGIDLSTLKPHPSQTQVILKEEIGRGDQSHLDALEEKLIDVKARIEGSEENTKKELEVLWGRVETTETMLMYLKSKAEVMAVPHLAHLLRGIKRIDGVGFVDKNGVPVSGLSSKMDLFSSDRLDHWSEISNQHVSPDGQDGDYIRELAKSVQFVTEVMETLVERVIMAESETAVEKEKVTIRQDDIRRKALLIQTMSMKLEEMEKFRDDTNDILVEMRQKVEDLIEETSRQKQRATENEEELCRVKQDFEALKSYVTSLIGVRETLVSSEKQFKKIECLFERLMVKTTQLESEKAQKEGEVQKLMQENVRLTDLLDKKEAQLLAMNEQCKMMALSGSNI